MVKKFHSTTSFEAIKKRYTQYIANQKDLDFIDSVWAFVNEMHKDQRRKNGDPYIYHLLSVADILIDWKVGPKTISCALLHDVIEDQPVTYEDVKNKFSEEIADVVRGVTKLDHFRNSNKKILSYANLRRLLLAMTKDIRIVIIKLADRLHNMRTLEFLPLERRKAISKETLYVFAPIAHRLGMMPLSKELEDLSFLHYLPKQYHKIQERFAANAEEREKLLNDFLEIINQKFKNKIEIIKMFSRQKGIYSIYRKFQTAGVPENEIFDLQAVRLIVENKMMCYQALGLIHETFLMLPNRFKDYIASPKNNLYQSLHTSVLYKNHIFEVQIRTPEMDEVAEKGIAAHYFYKENITNAKEITVEIDNRLSIFKDLIDLKNVDKDNKVFFDNLKNDVFNKMIYVLTPKGETKVLPYGAIVLDFAFKIHTEVGLHARGALINGKFSSIDTVLKSGDIVSIKTNPNTFPQHEWLNKVKTVSAQHKIKSYFKKTTQKIDSKTLQKGKRHFNEFCAEYPKFAEWLAKNEKSFLKILATKAIGNWDNLYYLLVTTPSFRLKTIINNSTNLKLRQPLSTLKTNALVKTHSNKSNKDLINIDNIQNLDYQFANCCSPVFGEKILGFFTKTQGLKIHKRNCRELKNYFQKFPEQKERLVDVNWNMEHSQNADNKSLINLLLYAYDRPLLINDIALILQNLNINLTFINAQSSNDTEKVIIKLKILVKDKDVLERVLNNLKKVPSVYLIKRTRANFK